MEPSLLGNLRKSMDRLRETGNVYRRLKKIRCSVLGGRFHGRDRFGFVGLSGSLRCE